MLAFEHSELELMNTAGGNFWLSYLPLEQGRNLKHSKTT